MARMKEIDQPRYARWVSVSHSIDALEPGLAVFIQGLGKIDAQLVFQDMSFKALTAEKRDTFEEATKLTDRFTMSQLWVLGAYEVVRTLSQRTKEKPKVITKKLASRILSAKKTFERLRIPLAKFEPAKRHTKTDFAVARPALHREQGISWRVAQKAFVPRRRLSDSLYTLLSAIQEHQERKARHLTSRSKPTR